MRLPAPFHPTPVQMAPYKESLARLLVGSELSGTPYWLLTYFSLAGFYLVAMRAGSIWVPIQFVGATAGGSGAGWRCPGGVGGGGGGGGGAGQGRRRHACGGSPAGGVQNRAVVPCMHSCAVVPFVPLGRSPHCLHLPGLGGAGGAAPSRPRRPRLQGERPLPY